MSFQTLHDAPDETGALMPPRKPTPSDLSEAYRKEVIAWVEALEQRFGISRNELATRAGVASSTVYRWFDRSTGFAPSQTIILKIAAALGVDPPGARGFAETGVSLTGTPEAEPPPSPNQSWWRVRDRALDLAGFLPGDRILLDQNEPPRAGDAVIAQFYDRRGGAETKLRWYAPPYLMLRTSDLSMDVKPAQIDPDDNKIMGPIIRLVRDRF